MVGRVARSANPYTGREISETAAADECGNRGSDRQSGRFLVGSEMLGLWQGHLRHDPDAGREKVRMTTFISGVSVLADTRVKMV